MTQAKNISLYSSFSSGNISELFVRFDICMKKNGWNDEYLQHIHPFQWFCIIMLT